MPASRHFFVSSKNAFAVSAMIGIVEASGRSKERIALQASSPSITGTTFKFDMNLTIRFIVFHRII